MGEEPNGDGSTPGGRGAGVEVAGPTVTHAATGGEPFPGAQSKQDLRMRTHEGFDEFVDAHSTLSPADFQQYKEHFVEKHSEGKHTARISRVFFSKSGAAAILWWRPSRRGVFGRVRVWPDLSYRPPDNLLALGPEFSRDLFRADQVIIEAQRTLATQALLLCYEMLHSALVYLFRLADEISKEHVTIDRVKPDIYKVATDQLQEAWSFYLRASRRRSLTYYLLGIFVGVAVLLLGFLALTPWLLGLPLPIQPVIAGSVLAAGGLGAVLSVMIRISRSQLSLAPDMSDLEIVVTGAFRPAVGLISGFAIFLIINSGLLPFKVPDSSVVSAWFFWVTIAFVAGFSERLIPDTIVRAESRLTSSGDLAYSSDKGDRGRVQRVEPKRGTNFENDE